MQRREGGTVSVPAPEPPDSQDAWYAPDVCTQDEVLVIDRLTDARCERHPVPEQICTKDILFKI